MYPRHVSLLVTKITHVSHTRYDVPASPAGVFEGHVEHLATLT